MSAASFARRGVSRSHATRRIGSDRPARYLVTRIAAAGDGLHEVASVKGVRIIPGPDYENPNLQYLVEWKGDKEKTWEPKINLSPDLVRDFDDSWWTACREIDKDALAEMIYYGGSVLAHVFDEDGRTALHFCAARGRGDLCKLLLEVDADPNFPDKDGYSPLHMAAGYLHTHIVTLFLEHGADAQLPDDQGRTPLTLLTGLRDNLPADNPTALARRMALEHVISTLTQDMYETLPPVAVLDVREINGEREYLVEWPDEAEDSWVPAEDVAEDVKEDFEKGLEYGEVAEILDRRIRKSERFYLVRWTDGYEDSWENEDSLATELVESWEKNQKREALKADSTALATT